MTTREVILTLALVLGAELLAGIVAELLRLPRLLLLLGAGALLGLSVSDAIDVPLDSIAVVTVVTAAYFVEDTAGGSGYLGVFLAGLIVGNMDKLRLGRTRATSAACRLRLEEHGPRREAG